MLKRATCDPAEALFRRLGFSDLLESIARAMARTGACPLSAVEALDPASIKAAANLAAERNDGMQRFSRGFHKQLSAIEDARIDADLPRAIAAPAIGDMHARAASYESAVGVIDREIRSLECELDGIEQRGEGTRSAHVSNLLWLGAGTGGLAMGEMAMSAAFLVGAGHDGGWLGNGSLAAMYGIGNTLSAYLLGDYLLRPSASRGTKVAKAAGTAVMAGGVLALNAAFGLLRLFPSGVEDIQSGIRLITIEHIEVSIVRFDVVGVVLIGPVLFAWMTKKWHAARNVNLRIDRIERALVKLRSSRNGVRLLFEADVEDLAIAADDDLDDAQADADACVRGAKRALVAMHEALSEHDAAEQARVAAHAGAVNLFRARLAARVDRSLLPVWVQRAADMSGGGASVGLSDSLPTKVQGLDCAHARFVAAAAAARAALERTRRLILGLSGIAVEMSSESAGPARSLPSLPPVLINPAE